MEGIVKIKDKEFVPYISEIDIQKRIVEVAAEVNRDYHGKSPLMIVVLNGAFMFAADLVRNLHIEPEIQFIRISTYGNSMSSSKDAQLLLGLEVDVEGRDIILIEDIVETGYTVGYFIDEVQKLAPSSIKLVSLLYKPEKFKGSYPPDYIGFEIPGAFVVGYGLDYAQQGRELRSIYQLKE
ncbi:MAG: hypoxanthine phosphoribosyltransferase [Bacteroidia bacterium]|nr:hypoxanthine phosphoribosyltransferase [Bacteroidia bacterium]